ncbi:MAG: hypothetical protein J7496_02955 [Novosphingobium sp.]|nr:hypothetical protein [Novosphingobium sp.]MBO9601448.1 hypothetical protein [Novosphingobium sp.]
MASLTVRDIDDDDYENLRRIAQKNNRSTSAQVREMIAEANRRNSSSQEAVARLREFQRKNGLKLPAGTTSLDLLREERDS